MKGRRRPGSATPGIRLRLHLALALLAAATFLMGLLSWYALDRADEKLENLHRDTLTEVARALALSKRSAELVTSAPFLLGLRSPYLIRSEGEALIRAIQEIDSQLSANENGRNITANGFARQVSSSLTNMKQALADLIVAADRLDAQHDIMIRQRAILAEFDKLFAKNASDGSREPEERRNWTALQKAAGALISAAYVDSLPSLGEYQRKFTRTVAQLGQTAGMTAEQRGFLAEMLALSEGEDGLFAVRRRDLDQNLFAQSALFRIRYESGRISEVAMEQARAAEDVLSQNRQETTSSINLAKLAIIGIGLGSGFTALIAALYVSGYVTGNIHAISDAMERLAKGDRKVDLPRPKGKVDEIGKLLRAFRVFRANALRLDRSNRQLRQRNMLFERIFNNISDGVAITDETGRLTAANPCLPRVLRLPDGLMLRNVPITQVLASSPFAGDAERQELGNGFQPRMVLHGKDGDVLEVRCSRLPDGGEIWLFTDETERRKVEERLSQIRRIESLGRVTGEVAHDFANILSSISGNLHLLEVRGDVGDTSAVRKRIASAVEIGTSLTERLLAFARKQRLEPEVIELNTLVAGLEDLVSIGLKDGVRLETDLGPKPLHVRVDPGQLESGILNLCLNSSQAIEGAGHIRISVRKGSDHMAVIEIEDDGCGMDEGELKRATEPFYSARGDGGGTGLGLSSVYGFIVQSGGDLQIESRPGEGTQVRLLLPVVEEETEKTEPCTQPVRILLVEDEADALRKTARLLRRMGHDVHGASHFSEARRLLLENHEYDVLLTDIHLDEGHSGLELVDLCLERRAPWRIIVTSGREADLSVLSRKRGDRVCFVPKPIDAAALAMFLAEAKVEA